MTLFSDFKAFAMKGNVVDMAVGVVVGGAFSKIVSSLVNGIIMPLASMVTGQKDISNLALVLKEAAGENPAVTLNYGMFIQNIVDFLIIAFCIFMCIRLLSGLHRKQEAAPAAAPLQPAPPTTEELLGEIRALLEKNLAQK